MTFPQSQSTHSYLGVDFTSNAAWDMHVKKVIESSRKKVNQLHSVIGNRDIGVSARRIVTFFSCKTNLGVWV